MKKDHEWSLTETELDALVKRLRRLKVEADLEERNAGITDGVIWARDCASPKALEFLTSLEDGELDFLTEDNPGVCLAGRMADAMGYDPEDPWTVVQAVYELFGESRLIRSGAYVKGFTEGSLRVWAQARPGVYENRVS